MGTTRPAEGGPRRFARIPDTGPVNALLAAVAVLGVSASGPLMAATTAPALAIAFWRNAAALAVLAPVTLLRRRDELAALSARVRRLAVVAVDDRVVTHHKNVHFGRFISAPSCLDAGFCGIVPLR